MQTILQPVAGDKPKAEAVDSASQLQPRALTQTKRILTPGITLRTTQTGIDSRLGLTTDPLRSIMEGAREITFSRGSSQGVTGSATTRKTMKTAIFIHSTEAQMVELGSP